jgi:hypothetical protein
LGEYDYYRRLVRDCCDAAAGAIRRPLRPTFADRPHTLSVMANTRLARDVDFARISLTTHHGARVVRVIYDGPVSGGQLSEVA